MLHELLLALHGHRGHVFHLEEGEGRSRVSSALPLFHPAEKAVLESLLATAEQFASLEQFVKTHGDAMEEEEDEEEEQGGERRGGGGGRGEQEIQASMDSTVFKF